MRGGPRGPIWVSPLRLAGRCLLRSYPPHLADEMGAEMLDALERRVLDRARDHGPVSAFRLAAREMIALGFAGVEARRELARAVRLGAPGRAGLDVAAAARWVSHDVVESLRGIRRVRAPSLTVILLIGLGVGAGTSIFTVVDGVLLDPLPFPRSDELVYVWTERPWQDEQRGLLADDQVQQLQREASGLESVSALWMVSGRILGGERPVHTDVGRVSAHFFEMLGVEPLLGRTFREGEDRPGAPWVAILTYDYWMEELGGDHGALGSTIKVGWPDMEVIGVLPPDFRFEIPSELGAHGVPDVWIPWWHSASSDGRFGGGMLAAVARMAEGADRAESEQTLSALAQREDRDHYGRRGFSYSLERLQDDWVGDTRAGLLLLAAAVSIVLLIATANAATLLMTRTQVRQRELGLRRALGASRIRIARLLVTETLLLTGAGGMLGFLIATLGTRGLLGLAPPGLPPIEGLEPDRHVLAFTLAVSGLAGLAAVLAPLARVRTADAGEALREGAGRTRTASRRARRARNSLVVVQVALSVVLVAGAGLLARTFQEVRGTDLGFESEDRVTFSVYLMEEYGTLESQVAFYTKLRDALADLPGVHSVGGSSSLPLSAGSPQVPVSTFARERDVDPEGFFLTEGFSVLRANELDGTEGDGWVLADLTAAQPGYFDAAGIDILAGRALGEHDALGSPRTVVIDRTLAEHLWSVSSSIGERLWIAGAWREVVGVSDHARLVGVRKAARPQAYLPYSQVRSGRVSMVVHADRGAADLVPEIRARVAELDPLVPIADVRSLEGIVRAERASDRFSMTLMGIFATSAVLLAALGIYGALSFVVGERTREIAVRMTVGSGEARLAGIVVGEGLRLAGLGAACGTTGALLIGGAARPLLYGVEPHDPPTLVATIALVITVALVASWIPTRRALAVDPSVALSSD